MEKDYVNEIIKIFKQLNPENQRYFLSLVKVAQVAENNAKNKKIA